LPTTKAVIASSHDRKSESGTAGSPR
jgi:hypothetical protein